MSESSAVPPPGEAASELRRRHIPPYAPAREDGSPPASSPADPEGASWQAQLAEARRAMAARMEQEYQELDAGAPAPGEGEASVAEGSGGRAEEGDEATQHRRRASVASSEGDDELVERLLRPQAAQAIPEEPSGGDAKASEEEEKGDAPPQDDRMCRICFSGDDENGMGKLFSPCLCRGTSRHVHTKCLESWRKASANPRAFYQCDQCGYQYRFRRTAFARAITNPLTVTFLTCLLFSTLVFLAGFIANSLIAIVEARQSAASGFFDDFFVSDHILVGEGIRDAVSFVEHQLDTSRWASARTLALQRAAAADSSSYRFFSPSAGARTPKEPLPAAPLAIRALMHFTKGGALLGIISTFYTYAAATFVSPLGRTLFRALRPAGGRRRAADRAAGMGQMVVLFLIVVGVVKSVRQTYRGVKWLTRIALSRVEDLVIEVNA
ncbi:hypothetical protein JCM10450v2_000444 [Rhodotorula kratochvilovae]